MKNSFINKTSILVILSLITIGWVYVAGRDLNWDFLNYHLYGAALMLDGRWDRDYFAGSLQSYLNPVAYIPIYLMARAGVPDLIVGGVLALPALAGVWAIWALVEDLIREESGNISLKVVASLLALTTSLWLVVVGSTFADSLTCVLVIFALHQLLNSRNGAWKAIIFAGLLLGIATGIKLTNGVFAISFTLVLVWMVRGESYSRIVKYIFLLASGSLIGFVLLHGYWSWKLWTEFGNPFFPFFNEYFKSPDFVVANLHDRRFMGGGALGVLTLPFAMVGIQSWIYNEARAPEIKLAISLVIIAGAFVISIGKVFFKRGVTNSHNNFFVDNIFAVTIFAVSAYVLWAFSSRIGRYALPIWVILGILIPALLSLFFRYSAAKVISGVILVLQLFLNSQADVSHWGAVTWQGKEWFKPDIPLALRDKPHTVLTASLQSYSALVPYFHPDSRWSNVSGQNSLQYGSEMPEKLAKNIGKGDVVAVMPAVVEEGGNRGNVLSSMEKEIFSSTFLPFGLQLDSEKCMLIKMPQTQLFIWTNDKTVEEKSIKLRACSMRPADEAEARAAVENARRYDKIFAEIEKKCPVNADPPGVVSTPIGKEVSRYYFNTASYIYTEEKMILFRPPQQLLRHVVAVIDPESGKLVSDIVCHKYPDKLYLD